MDSRIKIFTGHFGSGKTEIAINYAIKLAKEGEKVTLVDIDIVNPYFCSRDMKEMLENEYGIKVIASNPSLSNIELAVVPPEIYSVFNDKSRNVIMDIGGDDSGAIVLGQYNKYFKEEPYDMYFVVNNNRPFTLNSEDTKEYLRSVERSSRLNVNYLISNTNMSYETTAEDIIKGDVEVQKLSKELNIPQIYTVCTKDLEEQVKDKVHGSIFTIDIYMKPPWR